MKNIPKAKEIIRKCQDDLVDVLSDGDMSEVYHLVFALYPVTNISDQQS